MILLGRLYQWNIPELNDTLQQEELRVAPGIYLPHR
jgi:hypothetical protein